MVFMFGSGIAYATPLNDATGATISNPTPVKFAAMQDISVEFGMSLKQLYGSKQFPIAIGRGTGKISGKAKIASVNGTMLNNLFFGETLSAAASSLVYQDTTGTAVPGTPYQITPTPPASGTWLADLGVQNSNGIPLTRVASAPATGQYSVSAGVYTFAAADTTLVMYISFSYTVTTAGTKKLVIHNNQLGYQPSFSLALAMPYNNKSLTLLLNNAVSGKIAFATKLDDFNIPDLDFECFADANDVIGTLSVTE